jgi:LAGLIDADG DNA endonuclease family
MDSGNLENSSFILYTHAMTRGEIYLLINALKRNFGIDSSIYKTNDKNNTPYILYIKPNS